MRTITKRTLTLAATTVASAGLMFCGLPAAASPATHTSAAPAPEVARTQVEGEVEAVANGEATIRLKTGARVQVRLASCIVIGGPLVEGVQVRLGVNLLGFRILVVL